MTGSDCLKASASPLPKITRSLRAACAPVPLTGQSSMILSLFVRAQHQRDALQRDEHRKRRDQRRQLDDANEKAVEKADERGDSQRQSDAEDEEPWSALLAGEKGQ